MYATKVVKFTTGISNANILQNSDVKAAIKERMGITTEDDYDDVIDKKLIRMRFSIFFSGANTVSVNGQTANDLIEDAVYSSGGFVNVESIIIGTPAICTISFDIE